MPRLPVPLSSNAHRFNSRHSRRGWLAQTAVGSAAGMLQSFMGSLTAATASESLATLPRRAKSVIMIFNAGAQSH